MKVEVIGAYLLLYLRYCSDYFSLIGALYTEENFCNSFRPLRLAICFKRLVIKGVHDRHALLATTRHPDARVSTPLYNFRTVRFGVLRLTLCMTSLLGCLRCFLRESFCHSYNQYYEDIGNSIRQGMLDEPVFESSHIRSEHTHKISLENNSLPRDLEMHSGVTM